MGMAVQAPTITCPAARRVAAAPHPRTPAPHPHSPAAHPAPRQGYCTGDPAARLRGFYQLWVVAAFSTLGMILVWAAELLLIPAGGK